MHHNEPVVLVGIPCNASHIPGGSVNDHFYDEFDDTDDDLDQREHDTLTTLMVLLLSRSW